MASLIKEKSKKFFEKLQRNYLVFDGKKFKNEEELECYLAWKYDTLPQEQRDKYEAKIDKAIKKYEKKSKRSEATDKIKYAFKMSESGEIAALSCANVGILTSLGTVWTLKALNSDLNLGLVFSLLSMGIMFGVCVCGQLLPKKADKMKAMLRGLEGGKHVINWWNNEAKNKKEVEVAR